MCIWNKSVIRQLVLLFTMAAIILTPPQILAKELLTGRTLEVMVGFSNTGGGARFWRVFSQRLRKALPETVVRARFNDIGSGVVGTSKLFKLPPGSLAVGFVRPPEIAFAQIHQRDGVDFDFSEVSWIVGVENDSFIMAARRNLPTDPQTLRDLDTQLIIPVSDILATHSTVSFLLNAVTGIPAKIVVGFKKSARKKALLAQDADMYTIAADDALKPLLLSGDIKSLYTIAGKNYPHEVNQMRTLESFLVPDAPSFVVDYIKSARAMGRAFFAPPAVDSKDVEALRTVFAEILTDPEFIKAAASQRVPVSAVDPKTVREQINYLLVTDTRAKAALDLAYDCGRKMSQGLARNCEFMK